jgi:hypothetical protein
MDPSEAHPRDDRVLPFTRGLSLFIVPFLLAGFVILYLFPTHTQRLFAWPVQPTMTAMFLASAYLGGAYFFVRVLGARRWHEIGTGFLSVAAFAGLLGVATLLHWSLFSHDHPAFWIWSALYFVAPFLVLAAWVANHRYAWNGTADEELLGTATRVVVCGLGLLALGWGLAMFIAPGLFVDRWPWALTPLSCRVLAATWCLGGAGLVVWPDPRWTTLRLMVEVEVEVVMVTLIVVGGLRAHTQIELERPLAWPLLAGFVGILIGSVWLLARHELPPCACSARSR